jgi:osmotically-inducible protein OsmY
MKADTELQHDVLAELEWDPSIDATQIGVAAKDGVVTLTGRVASLAAKMTAERAAKRVYGVKAVANEIEVDSPGSGERADADIAAAAVNALKWAASVPDDRVKVTVRSGWVTLDGTVDWAYQRASAHHVVCNLAGVKGVTNDIQVKAPVKPGTLRPRSRRRSCAAPRWTPGAWRWRPGAARWSCPATSARGRS